MFLKLDDLEQDYVIRLTSKRKLLYHNKWTPATELRDRRKGKIKTSVFYRGKEHEAYLSHVRVQITASRKDIYLVLVYGITEHPMMLATNKEIKSKEDVLRVARYIFPDGELCRYLHNAPSQMIIRMFYHFFVEDNQTLDLQASTYSLHFLWSLYFSSKKSE